MEREPKDPDQDPGESAEDPPPFKPDPDLIAHLERGGKPNEREVRELAEKVSRRR